MRERPGNFSLRLAFASTCGAVVSVLWQVWHPLAASAPPDIVPGWVITEGFLLLTVAFLARVARARAPVPLSVVPRRVWAFWRLMDQPSALRSSNRSHDDYLLAR